MVDDVQDNLEPHQQKGGGETAERVRSVRERREAEQRRRLDELRAHAAAAQAQREQRDAERRARASEQRAKEDERRIQVEERKRAIWEAGVSRREALLRRDREREERIERQRAARSCSSRTNVFAFGSSTPRMLEPADTGGIFWGHRSANPLDHMNFFESLASSTSNVMLTSAPLTRRSSTFDLDNHERDKKDEGFDSTPPVMWSSVARRRTDLVPTIPAPRPPGRAYSMTRLDRIQPQRTLQRTSPSMSHLAGKNHLRSGETTPGSRPGSAMSQSTTSRRPNSTPRRPRPASIAGTPRGADVMSMESTPTVSRDATSTNMSGGGGGDASSVVVRRPHTARRPRPASMHATPTTPLAAGDGKPPLHRKPKPPKDQEKTPSRPGGRVGASPSDSSKEPTPARDIKIHRPQPREQKPSDPVKESNQVNAAEVTQKLEALQLKNQETEKPETNVTEAAPKQAAEQKSDDAKSEAQKPAESQKPTESQKPVEVQKPAEVQKLVEEQKPAEVQKPAVVQKSAEVLKTVEVQKPEMPKPAEQRKEERANGGQEKMEETDMTASMIARSRITTEEEAKAALAERRRKAREELERQAELERQRLAREEAEAEERRRQEEELERQLEEEARELAELRRTTEQQKLREAIEAQQQLEREAREKAAREEAERIARLKEEEAERVARLAAEAARKEEAEREEAERRARKQRVEAIMLRTRQKKAEEDKKQQESKNTENANSPALQPTTTIDNTQQQQQQAEQQQDNGNGQTTTTTDLLGLTNDNNTSHVIQSTVSLIEAERNSNVNLIQPEKIEHKSVDNVDLLTSNVDLLSSNVDLLSQPVDSQSNVDLLSSQLNESIKSNGQSKEDAYTIHNGLKENNGLENVLNNGSSQYPLTVHNAV